MSMEVYENNGGGVFLVILDSNSNPVAIFHNWEYIGIPGHLKMSIQSLLDGTSDYHDWCGDMMEDLSQDCPDFTIQDAYEELGTLVAYTDESGFLMMFPEEMGFAARECLGIR